MVTPVLTTLSRNARLALPFVERSVIRGETLDTLQSSLTASGRGVRRETLSQLRNYYRERVVVQTHIRNTPKRFMFGERRMKTSLTRIPNRIAFVVRATGRSRLTGLIEDRFVTIGSDVNLTIEDVEDIASSRVKREERYGLDEVRVTVVDAVKRSDFF